MRFTGWISRLAAASTVSAPSQEPLPSGGRSSLAEGGDWRASVASLDRLWAGIQPYDPLVLRVLTALAVWSPVMSQAAWLLQGTINGGHDLVLDGPSRQKKLARERLEALARTAYPRSAGMDGLINHYIRQLAVGGAISSEDVLKPDLSGVALVAPVPVGQIRWRWAGGDWAAWQDTGTAQAELNRRTYAYYALSTLDGHPPYGVPPFVAAISSEEMQRDILKHLRLYAKKLGLMGITSISVPPPRQKPGEADHEYEARAQQYLDGMAAAYDRSYANGLLVGPDAHKVQHHNVSQAAGQVGTIMQMVEQLLMSGLGIDPAMFGRSFSTTETYAGVVYNLLLRGAAQYQRLIKRRIERTYTLDLLLAGLSEVSVSLSWHEPTRLKPAEDAQADKTRTETVLLRLRAGIIDADQAAQELGYEQAARPAQAAHASGAAQTAPRPAVRRLTAEEEEAERRLQQTLATETAGWRGAALELVGPVREAAIAAALELLEQSPAMGEEQFAEAVLTRLSQSYGQAWAKPEMGAAVRELIAPHYRRWRTLTDLADAPRPAGGWSFGGPESRTLDLAAKLDQFYFGRYLDNRDVRPVAMLKQQWLEHGAGLFGRANPEAVFAFRQALDEQLRLLDAGQVQRIVDTSVQRLRAWAAVQQMAEAGVKYAEIWAILDSRTSAICREMHKRVVSIDEAYGEVDYLTSLSAEDMAAHLRLAGSPQPADVRLGGQAALAARGCLLPPYHPRCRTRLKMSLKQPPDPQPAPDGMTEAQARAWNYWQELPADMQSSLRDEGSLATWPQQGKLAKHEHDHPEIGAKDAADYDRISREVIAGRDRVLLSVDATGNRQLAYVQGSGTDWRVTVVDLDIWGKAGEPAIKTCYAPKLRRPGQWDQRLASMRKDGWTEVYP